ncbi:hypothetical protein ALP59_200057 [Pseudomonas savastanoi]|uniref:Uncharacterized protein n=1 Tax=Pseudomonas savastanoi TaxID=29438 RepID=A0A3M5FMT3_PSESS|nr:hypothetical protein ALP59_200057 [Pseudomonas savastanoi]
MTWPDAYCAGIAKRLKVSFRPQPEPTPRRRHEHGLSRLGKPPPCLEVVPRNYSYKGDGTDSTLNATLHVGEFQQIARIFPRRLGTVGRCEATKISFLSIRVKMSNACLLMRIKFFDKEASP